MLRVFLNCRNAAGYVSKTFFIFGVFSEQVAPKSTISEALFSVNSAFNASQEAGWRFASQELCLALLRVFPYTFGKGRKVCWFQGQAPSGINKDC